MPKFRKKPVEIEAMQWNGTPAAASEIIAWVLDNGGTARYVGTGEGHPMRREDEFEYVGRFKFVRNLAPEFIVIDTLEGAHRNDVRDFTIRGIQDEFYPCKPDIFEATYEAVP